MSESVGTHLVAELNDVANDVLVHEHSTSACLREALEESAFTILKTTSHTFPNGGFTTVFLLAESHASLHTYPEWGYIAFDLFSCGEKDPKQVLDRFVKLIGGARVESQSVERRAQTQHRAAPTDKTSSAQQRP